MHRFLRYQQVKHAGMARQAWKEKPLLLQEAALAQCRGQSRRLGLPPAPVLHNGAVHDHIHHLDPQRVEDRILVTFQEATRDREAAHPTGAGATVSRHIGVVGVAAEAAAMGVIVQSHDRAQGLAQGLGDGIGDEKSGEPWQRWACVTAFKMVLSPCSRLRISKRNPFCL